MNDTQTRFTAHEFQEFARHINCMSDFDFADMYVEIFGNPSKDYINEKFNLCRESFLNWFCNLDAKTLEAMMKYCQNN